MTDETGREHVRDADATRSTETPTAGTDTRSTDTSSTHTTEEPTMDEGTTGTARPEGATGTARAEGATAGTATRHADDDAPWSVPSTAPTTTARPGAGPEVARGVRVGTVVWGVVVIVAGALLAAAAAGVVFDVQLAVIATVALAGVALVVGSLVSASRRPTRGA